MALHTSGPRSSMNRGSSSTVSTRSPSTLPAWGRVPSLIAPMPELPPATKPPISVFHRGGTPPSRAAGSSSSISSRLLPADAQHPALQPLHRVQRRQVDHHPAVERHGLAIVAGAGPEGRQRQAAAHAIAHQPHQFVLVLGRDDDVGGHVGQLVRQDRREPEEVAALAADAGRAEVAGHGRRSSATCFQSTSGVVARAAGVWDSTPSGAAPPAMARLLLEIPGMGTSCRRRGVDGRLRRPGRAPCGTFPGRAHRR